MAIGSRLGAGRSGGWMRWRWGMTCAGFESAGSPDRAGAMVWALGDLFKPRAEPRLRLL